jgi:tartrate dehydratase alpha subunit/fumarate hydratase class I-like protein
MEQELLEDIDPTGIDTMGPGGYTSVLNVHIENDNTQITPNNVAVNTECWVVLGK